MTDADRGRVPSKLYYRIGEVAELVGVEPHVLRYWEREFRSIRPTKSAKGQRVYSRRDVENLLRVRQLLYSEGFTIAGARKKLGHPSPNGDPEDADGMDPSKAREQLLAIRRDIEAFLDGLDDEAHDPRHDDAGDEPGDRDAKTGDNLDPLRA